MAETVATRRQNDDIALALIRADVDALRQDVTDVIASVKSLTGAISSQGKMNFGVLASWGGVMVAFIALAGSIVWFTINQNVQLSLSPIVSNQSRMAENQHAHDDQIGKILSALDDLQKSGLGSQLADVQSRTDRSQLNDRVKVLETRSAEGRAERSAEIAALGERSVEVETQFRAEDRIRNIQFAEQQRMNAMLWNKLHPGEPYPSVAYFPEMAQERASGGILGK